MVKSNVSEMLNKLADDEPIFILRAKDILAPEVVKDWCERATVEGCVPKAKIEEAQQCAENMKKWQKINGAKFPD